MFNDDLCSFIADRAQVEACIGHFDCAGEANVPVFADPSGHAATYAFPPNRGVCVVLSECKEMIKEWEYRRSQDDENTWSGI